MVRPRWATVNDGATAARPQIDQRPYASRQTARTGLAHVFAKLLITSRSQLAADAARHRG